MKEAMRYMRSGAPMPTSSSEQGPSPSGHAGMDVGAVVSRDGASASPERLTSGVPVIVYRFGVIHKSSDCALCASFE